MELANLTPAELASAAKADASGVTIEARDSDGNLIDSGPAVVVPPAAAAAVKTKPEGVPDKFWNATTGEVDVASLARSYTELEKNRGKPAEAPKPAAPAKSAALVAAEAALAAAQAAEAPAPAAVTPPAAGDASQVQETAVAAATAEFSATGKLSDATYEALSKSGLPKAMVDSYIAGQQVQLQAAVAESHALAGGPEGYTAMTDWARVNLTPQQIAEYDAGVQNGATAKLAIKDLFAKYQAAVGRDGSLVTGGNGTAQPGGGYQTQSEMTAAIRDPRYKSDATYRAQVEAKIGKTADHIV